MTSPERQGAAAGGLKLKEVHLPDAVAAGDRSDERGAPSGGEVLAFAGVVDREHQTGFSEDAQAGGVGELDAVVSAQPRDLAVPPHREGERRLDHQGADPVARGRRPRPADHVTGVAAGATVVVGARGQPDDLAEPLDAEGVLDAELVELSETTCPQGPRA